VPTAWAAQNEAGNLAFTILILCFVVAVLWRRGWLWRLSALAILVPTLVLLVSTAEGNIRLPAWGARLELVLRNFRTVGLVQGYVQIPSVMVKSPHSFLVGTGPGSYGSALAVDVEQSGREAPPLAQAYTEESYRLNDATRGMLGSFVQKSTDLAAFLVEFGPLIVLCSIAALCFLVLGPAIRAMSSVRESHRAVGQWVLLSTCYLWLVSATTSFYGWSVAHTSTFAILAVGGSLILPVTRAPASAQDDGPP